MTLLHIELNIGRQAPRNFRIDHFDRMSVRKKGFTGKPFTWDIHNEFAKYLADIMRDEFSRAIDDERFKRFWPPLNMNYLRYKRMHHLSLKIWKATGLLQKSIVSKRRLGYYYVGVDPNKRYRNGAKVIDIAACMEYGTSRMPARPLFRPIFEDIKRHVNDYWDDFLDENDIDREEVNQKFSWKDIRNRLKNRRNQGNQTSLNESFLLEDYVPTIANNPYNSPIAVSGYHPGGGGFGSPTMTNL